MDDLLSEMVRALLFRGNYPREKCGPRKKQQMPSSPPEPQWQEGAGALLLVAAAHETGLLETLETALSSCASHTASRLAHLSSSSRQSLLQTLLFLGVVGLSRTWDLRGYTSEVLGLLTNRSRAYGYWYTERFLAQTARTKGADIFTDALAGWTTRLWQPFALKETDQPALFYIDGHRYLSRKDSFFSFVLP